MPDPRTTIIIGARDAASTEIKKTAHSMSGLGQSIRNVNRSAYLVRSLFTAGLFGGTISALTSLAGRTLEGDIALRKLSGAMDLTADRAGNALAPAISRVVDGFAQAVNWWSQGFQPLGQIIALFAGAGTIVGDFKDQLLSGKNAMEAWNHAAKAGAKTMAEWAPQADMASISAKKMVDVYRKNLPQAAEEVSRFNDRLKDLSASHNKALAKIAKEQSGAMQDAAEKSADAWMEAAKDIAKIESDLAEDIKRKNDDLTKHLRDLDRQRASDLFELAKESAKADEDAQRDIKKAESDRILSLADLDADIGKRLRDAKTEHERKGIMEERAERIADIERQSAERRAGIEERRREHQREIAERRAEIEKEFTLQRQLAKENTEAQIAEMRRQADERKAERAEQRNEQLADIQTNLNKELAALAERKAEEEAGYRESIRRETDAHNKRIKSILDIRTEQQKLNDAVSELEGRWEPAIQKALQYQNILTQTTNIPLPYPTSGGGGGGGPSSGFGQRGADFIVPPGFPNDSFRMNVSSGERVQVQPAGKSGKSVGTMIFNINGARDPHAVRREIESIFEQEALR